MSQQEELADKVHDPTPRKLEQARHKGEVARSTDLVTASAYAGILVAAATGGTASLMAFGSGLAGFLDNADQVDLRLGGREAGRIMGAAAQAAAPMLIWFVLPAATALAAIVAQRSLVVAPSKIAPRISRISPVSNARNKFGRAGLFEFAKSFCKLLVFSLGLALFIAARMDSMALTLRMEARSGIAQMVRLTVEFLFVSVLVAATIGGADALWQFAEHRRRNRMTDRELRDEIKEAEGDPALKQERRMRGQQIATSHMLTTVPDANVVIVNPTHVAVALKWDRGTGAAPIVTAKGQDEIARRIREIAVESGVPIHHDPLTARAILASTEIGQEIQPVHYRAVAAAIRFSDAMRQKARQRGWR